MPTLSGDQFFKKHDLIYKQFGSEPKPLIVARRLYCKPKIDANGKSITGCGQTIRLQLSHCLFYLWYSVFSVWTFFFLHYIEKKSVQFSYEQATKTSDARNAYRWLNKLKVRIPSLKAKLSFPEKPFTKPNDISAFLLHFEKSISPDNNPLLSFQTAFQKHAFLLEK